MIEEQLAPVRRYTRAEAARALNVPETWLERWVTERRVPHQRKGRPRGVWSTGSDMLSIGAMLPELMSTRQAVEATRIAPGTGPSDELLNRWARLTSAR